MTVDFPSSSYPANTPSANKPADVQTLQETFALLLRSYGLEKGSSQTNTFLEIVRPDQPDTDGKGRNQQQRENHQRTDKNDFTQTGRKLLDRSEIRKEEMNAGYQNRTDRQEMLRNNYREKVEHSILSPSAPPPAPSVAPPSDTVISNEPVPNWNHSSPQQLSVPEIAGANIQVPAANVAAPNNPAMSGQSGVVMPMNINAPIPVPASIVSPNVPPQTFTVFTPTGRFGQSQENADENEDEKEDKDDEKNEKKKPPFAVFESIRLETMRPVQRSHSRQPKESPSSTRVQQTVEKSHTKPNEAEPESSRSVKTVEDILNTPAQNVVVQKKGEPQPDQMQYLKRIAAACEAASLYAPIRLKINLDHLGTLSLHFFYKADKLALKFETPSKASAQFLRDRLDGLRTILANRNVKIADIEIYRE